jgi:glycosyltransferase involved in cell wall biosynthesis
VENNPEIQDMQVECGAETTDCPGAGWPVKISGHYPQILKNSLINISFNGDRLSLSLDSTILSENRFMVIDCVEGFSNQLMSLVMGLLLSHRHHMTLVLPQNWQTRTEMVVTDMTGSKKNQNVNFNEMFNVTSLQKALSLKGYETILQDEIDVPVSSFALEFHRKESIREIDFELHQFRNLTNILLYVGNLHMRGIFSDCEMHVDAQNLLSLVSTNFRDEIHQVVNEIKKKLPSNFNAIHLRIEEDAMKVWGAPTRSVLKRWETDLLNMTFSPSAPLYVARGGKVPLKELCKRFQCVDKFESAFVDILPLEFRNSFDVIAAVDFLVLASAKNFAGSAYSTFSHAVVSMRDPNHPSLELFLQESAVPFTSQTSDLMFGSVTPLLSEQCSEKRVSELNFVTSSSIPDEYFAMLRARANNLNLGELSSEELTLAAIALAFAQNKHQTAQNLIERDVTHMSERSKLLFSSLLCGHYKRSICPRSPFLKRLVASHNLNVEGAPTVLLKYLKFLVISGIFRASDIDVICSNRSTSLRDTPLIHTLKQLQISVKFTNTLDPTGYDLVLINTVDMWWISEVSKRKGSLDWMQRVVWWVHEAVWKPYGVNVKNLLPLARRVIFVSKESQDAFPFVDSSRSTIISNYADQIEIRFSQLKSMYIGVRKQLDARSLVYILVGTIHQSRHQLEFVEAAGRLLRSGKCKDCLFILMGFPEFASPGSYEAEVISKVSLVGRENFILLSKRKKDVAFQIMHAADVVVSIGDTESFGMVLVEAMSMGKPLIVRKIGAVKSVAYPQSLSVKLEPECKDLELAMETMFSPSIRTKHALWAMQHSKKYSIENFYLAHVSNLLNSVQEILSIGSLSCEDAKLMYLEIYPDVLKAQIEPWYHFSNFGKTEGRKWPGEEC